MLSQEILKLQVEISNHRPGVMIGEGASATSTGTSAPSTTTSSPAVEPSAKSGNGNSHVVARGETLTSIAKMYGVSVSELQKYNHIDNPLKLLAGQTLLIPPSPIPSPSSSGEYLMDEVASQSWFLRKHADGSLFGPISFDQLADWASVAQVAPQHLVSADQAT